MTIQRNDKDMVLDKWYWTNLLVSDRLHPVRKDGIGEIDHASDGDCCEQCADECEYEGVLFALAFDGVVMCFHARKDIDSVASDLLFSSDGS